MSHLHVHIDPYRFICIGVLISFMKLFCVEISHNIMKSYSRTIVTYMRLELAGLSLN